MTTVWIYTFSDGTCLKLIDKGLSVEEVWKMQLVHGTCEVSHWFMNDGHWIYHPDWQADGECGYECSECGRGVDLDYAYCPHCGARMNGAMKV